VWLCPRFRVPWLYSMLYAELTYPADDLCLCVSEPHDMGHLSCCFSVRVLLVVCATVNRAVDSPKGLMCGRSGQQQCCNAPNVCVGGSQCINLGPSTSMFAPSQIATQQQLQSATPLCSGDTILIGDTCCPAGSVCQREWGGSSSSSSCMHGSAAGPAAGPAAPESLPPPPPPPAAEASSSSSSRGGASRTYYNTATGFCDACVHIVFPML